MTRHFLPKAMALGVLLSLSPLPAWAETAPKSTTEAAEAVRAPVYVALDTAEGRILLELDRQNAPLTSDNFLRYVDQKRLDDTSFYRALSMAPDGVGLIQGGVRGDPERLLDPVAHEPTTKTGLSHVDGSISMARGAPGSAAGDFFIIVGDRMTGLNASPDRSGDNAGYAVFGRVVSGMDIVRNILSAPISQTEGEGTMKGQILAKPVTIRTAARAAPPPRDTTPPTDEKDSAAD